MLYGDLIDFEKDECTGGRATAPCDSEPLSQAAETSAIQLMDAPAPQLPLVWAVLGNMLGGGVLLAGLFMLPFVLQRLVAAI
jgi:hypothetical protein